MNTGQRERLEIVAYNPAKRFLVRALLVVLLVALALGSYYYGRWSIWHERGAAVVERNELRTLTREQKKELVDLRRRVLVTESSNAVDRRAYQEVQQTVLNLNARIAQLENELHFYQRVMAPETIDQGLRIDSLELRPAGEDRAYEYQVVITQVADNNNFIEGRALISLVGSRGQTKNVTLPLKDVSEDVDDLSVRFRFRFFQNITGRLTLPDDFEPEKVQVILQSTGNRAMRIEQEFDWSTQEAL